MIDLREHFGIWDQCGNTRFFVKRNPWKQIYLNPLDGTLIVARDETKILPPPPREPRYTLVVRDAKKAKDDAIENAFAANQPWVERAVKEFFYYRAVGWALDAVKEFTGKEPIPGDRALGNFLRLYKSGGERYRNKGAGPSGDEPFLEEALEAISRMMNSMDGITVDYGRNLSQADLDEALADLGVLECV